MSTASEAYMLDEAKRLVSQFFAAKNEPEKAERWWTTPNEQLGGMKPIALVELGRVKRVLDYIRHAQYEGGW